MSRICSWCSAFLAPFGGAPQPVTHALCRDCLRDLQAGLGAKGLRLRAGEDPNAPH